MITNVNVRSASAVAAVYTTDHNIYVQTFHLFSNIFLINPYVEAKHERNGFLLIWKQIEYRFHISLTLHCNGSFPLMRTLNKHEVGKFDTYSLTNSPHKNSFHG